MCSKKDYTRVKKKAAKRVTQYARQPIFGNMFSDVKSHKAFNKIKIPDRYPVKDAGFIPGAEEIPEFVV